MKILLTGGAGFIGSHLGERLLRDGHELVIIDELNDFYSPAVKKANLESVLRAGPAAFYEADICDENAVTTIAAQHKPDVIIHLAARAGVRPSLEQPLLYERTNVRGTMVLLEEPPPARWESRSSSLRPPVPSTASPIVFPSARTTR